MWVVGALNFDDVRDLDACLLTLNDDDRTLGP